MIRRIEDRGGITVFLMKRRQHGLDMQIFPFAPMSQQQRVYHRKSPISSIQMSMVRPKHDRRQHIPNRHHHRSAPIRERPHPISHARRPPCMCLLTLKSTWGIQSCVPLPSPTRYRPFILSSQHHVTQTMNNANRENDRMKLARRINDLVTLVAHLATNTETLLMSLKPVPQENGSMHPSPIESTVDETARRSSTATRLELLRNCITIVEARIHSLLAELVVFDQGLTATVQELR